MDYSFFGATPQPYFMGMPNNGFGQGVDPDTIRSIVSPQADSDTEPRTALEPLERLADRLQEPLESGFLGGPYDAFSFTSGLPTTHGSPDPAVAATPLQVGSVDSGIGGEVEDARASRTRSSSEEKEAALTPAQSRRKAQNRAAYVVPWELPRSQACRLDT